MSRMMPLGLLLLALLAGSASAGRQSMRTGYDTAALKWMLGRRGTEGKGTAVVAIKYDVPPSLHTDFITEWRNLEDQTVKEKALLTYDLVKTTGDNAYFWLYGEWDTMKDFFDHLDCKYTQDFLDFLEDKDIKFDMYPLNNIAENTKKGKTSVGRRGKGGVDPRKGPAHVLVQYHVPPSMTTDFMDVWTDIADRTWDEKDNIRYSLHKVGTMNHHFIACGSWESLDAYLDHHTSKHMQKMHDYLADNDIMFFVEPVMPLGDSEKGL